MVKVDVAVTPVLPVVGEIDLAARNSRLACEGATDADVLVVLLWSTVVVTTSPLMMT
jgi:hypothetical protein